ncbi:MAG: hypothetical protein KAI69_02670 [Deltaproteobacteria bacterium]|nr:hypothetical protein [Deltaproteobacteria bacterium]
MSTRGEDLSADKFIAFKGGFESLAFNLEVIFRGSFGQVATVDKQALSRVGIAAQNINGCFLTGQTARLFFVSTAEFDIAGERAYIDEAKIRPLSPAAGGEKQVEGKADKGEKQQENFCHFRFLNY